MMNSQSIDPWQIIDNELENALLARKNGNEGKARVCARRAVSQALFTSGITSTRGLGAIQTFTENVSIPFEIREIGESFLEKVDETYQLKSGIDLIDNAQKIISFIRERKM
jgi:hypothetical protein